MYNSGFRSKTRAPDGTGTVAAQVAFVQQSDPQPTITSWSIQNSDDRALDPAGGQTVVVVGNGFTSGMTVTVGSTSIGSVTIVNSRQATFTSPAKTAGNYTLTMANSNGQAAILVPGLAYSTIVTWSTAAGSIGNTVETTSFTESVVATSDSSITYTLASGSLPTGATLNANGTITGTAVATASPTTYSFSITATDAELQDSTQSFTITVNPDTVTWVSPANGTNYSLSGNQAMSNVTLSATAASGSGITYSANALPTGVTLSGNTISGTPTVAQTVSTLLTATANTTSRYSTETITWTVSVGDIYWPYVSLLLNGSTPTTTFINDASLNNNMLTIAGDTKPNLFNPYSNGYYSNYFTGTNYISTPSSSAYQFGTGDFTVEAWVYMPVITNTFSSAIVETDNYSGVDRGWILAISSTGYPVFALYNSSGTGGAITSSSLLTANKWTHLAAVRSGTTVTLYKDGVSVASGTNANTDNFTGPIYIGTNASSIAIGVAGYSFAGYISNVRVTKGQALYTTNFTPSTTPLTTTSQGATAANVYLLTCQSSRVVDNSTNNYALTLTGGPTVSSAYPFATPTTSSYNTLYSTYFDGNGDYLTVPDNAAFTMGSGDFTVEFWLYLFSSDGSILNITGQSDNTGAVSSQSFVLYRNASNQMVGYVASGATSYTCTSTTTVTAGSWNHVALVRIGNTLTQYINGVANGTASVTGVTINDSTSVLGIGCVGAYTTSPVTGVISNYRVVKGVGVYTGAFTPPTSSLTATQSAGTNISAITAGQTSLLTCQNSTLIDNSTNAFAITSAGQAQPIAVSPFTMTTSTNTLTSLGSTYFDGTGDYLSSSTVPSTLPGNFTLEYWYYAASALSNSSAYLSFGTEASGRYVFTINSTGVQYNQYGVASTTIATYTFNINTWYHVAIVRTGTSLSAYVNGVNAGTVTLSGSLGNGLGFYIQGASTGATASNPYYLSDLRITNGTALYSSNFLPPQAPLTAVANTQLLTCQYNGGATNNGFVDQSSFNNIVTRTGNPTQGTFSPYSQTGWSNFFDGTGDYLSTSANAAFAFGTGDYTIEAWVYRTDSGTQRAIVDLRGGAYVNVLFYMNSANKLVAFNSTTSWIVSTGTIPLNQWAHVAITRSGTSAKLFINGVIDGTATNSDNNVSLGTPYIGRQFGSTINDWLGYISNVRVVKGQALYTTNFTPSTTPLTAVTNTSLLTCQSNRPIDNSPNNFAITVAGDTSAQAYSPFSGVTSVPTSYSVYFDGTGDYAASTTSVAITTGPFTIEFWVNPSALGTYRAILDNAYWNIGDNGGWNVYLNNDNTISLNASAVNVWNTFPTIIKSSSTISANTWTHVAIVRNASNQINVYFNGVVAATPVTYSTTLNTGYGAWTGLVFRLGYHVSDGTAYDLFYGSISNARVVNGTAVYTSAFTPPTSPLTAIANTVVLTCQSPTLIDNGPNRITFTTSGDCRPVSYNPFGATTATQVSYTPAVNGGSMYMSNAAANYLTVTNSNLWNTGATTPAFTVEAWIYPIGITGGAIISAMYANAKVPYVLGIGNAVGVLATNNQVWFGYYTGNTWTGIISTGQLTMNQWTHVAGVYTGTTQYLFLNGVMVASTTATWPAFDAVTTAGYIGKRWDGTGGGADGFNGYITDARITKGAALYTANFYPSASPATPTTTIGASTYASGLLVNGTSGGIIDYHSTNDLETVGNTQLAPQDPYGGSYYSNYFDGTGDYLSSPYNAVLDMGTGDCTMECWFYIAGNTSTNTDGIREAALLTTIPSGGGALTQDYSIVVSGNASVTGTGVAFNQRTAGTNYSLSYVGTITQGVWHHVAMSRTGNTLNLLYDGTRVAQNTNFTASITTATGGNPLKIGGLVYSAGYAEYLNGYISNLRLIKGTALYTGSTYTVPTSPLTAVANTAVLTCQSNKFVDNSTNAFTITRNGDTAVQSQNPFQQNTGKSLYFDGTGDYLVTPSTQNATLGTGDFTIECWYYYTGAAPGSKQLTLLSNLVPSDNSTWDLQYYSTGFRFVAWNSTFISATASLVANIWNYIAITRQGTTLTLWLNGSSIGTTSNSTNFSTVSALRVGWNGTNDYWQGYIDDARITKGIARYTTTFTPPTSPDQTN